MAKVARLPGGPISRQQARAHIKARFGEEDPIVALWGGASLMREKGHHDQRGRPNEKVMDGANAALLHAYPKLQPVDLAVLEAYFEKDTDEGTRFPTQRDWKDWHHRAIEMKGTVRARAHRRIRRAREVLNVRPRSDQAFTYRGTCTIGTVKVEASGVVPAGTEIRVRIELHSVAPVRSKR